VTVPQEALVRAGKALGLDGPIQALGPKKLDQSGRWLEVQLRGPKGLRVVSFDSLRRALGYGEVKSARIVAATPPFGAELRAGVTLEGLGRGHGVGLCQEGARDLARQGWSAEQILAAYYPGARLARVATRAVDAAPRP
jgi:stage II sporulation protein D